MADRSRAVGVPAAESRRPGLLNSALALAVLVVLATLSLVFHREPPPAVAEFAPQDQLRARFANPGAGQAPLYQATVGPPV